eukprot:3096239-Prymnesium_polylepis.1
MKYNTAIRLESWCIVSPRDEQDARWPVGQLWLPFFDYVYYMYATFIRPLTMTPTLCAEAPQSRVAL